ncbi:MAG TPA: serine hydrolase domain-containing protein [Devosia sp.]|jgi:CubicO group peptidase (beta-lactamase class C family)|uniref:serine hydrolase domain-containing protein n=1 Tax=Devosia sp. TaxID=1871048 RepID=UPI002F921ECE
MDLEQQLDAAITKAIADNRIVGSVVMVRQNGQVLYAKAHGLADREHNRPMTVDAIFRLSSLTKPIVAATILALVDDGKMDLQEPITTYLPQFRPRMATGEAPTITIHQLLTHVSGLSSASILTEAEQSAGVNRWRLGTEEILRRLADLPLLFAPGNGWSYGPGLDVLAAVAAQLVGGQPEDAIRKYVADPLNMADTRFTVTDPARLAAAYADGPDGPVLMGDPHIVPNKWGGVTTYDPGRILDAEAFQSGGGGMAGTAGDFMALLEALRTGGGPILTPEITALGLGNQTPQLSYSQSPGWQFSYFGAWLEDPVTAGTPASPGTNRWGGIYGHNWFIDPARGLSVASMSNTGPEGSDGDYVTEVRDAIYAALG